MDYKLIKENYLTDIANAIREMNDTEDVYKPREMAEAILALSSGMGPFTVSGDGDDKFSNNFWNELLDKDLIRFQGLTTAQSMFSQSNELTEIKRPIVFDSNITEVPTYCCEGMFNGCHKLEEIGDIVNLKMGKYSSSMFNRCYNLRYLPNFINLDTAELNTNGYSLSQMFTDCASLRSVNPSLLKQLWKIDSNTNTNSFYFQTFLRCYSLDEVIGLYPAPKALTENRFYKTFDSCWRLKNVTFATQENGEVYTVPWANQRIVIPSPTPYIANEITKNYNSGITADKEIIDDATYQMLKDNPDAWTRKIEYCRYNHDSAVNTILSLPDTSAFVVESGLNANVLQLPYDAGSATDGGAVNTLTEEEIAVAAAKGWTIGY